jgi:hypothetical protein
MACVFREAVYAVLVTAVLSAPVVAESAPFPPQLLGKSVAVNWTTTRQQVFEGSDEVVFRAFSSSLRVYISTAGRAFSKESFVITAGGGGRWGGRGRGGGGRALRGRSSESEQAPDDSRNAWGGNRIVHFEGGALLVDSPLIAGARRVSIAFDAVYGSCNARVVHGREGGTGAIRQRSVLSGQRFEVVSIQTSTPTCSITSGNVFGGP